ncbi:hypothetical protein BDZ89DRAFT_1048582 [Hymenopellis radicata]|nr:hypothetical protein BDZ89DRAFT_1048582 [Hymenopellis radicata]
MGANNSRNKMKCRSVHNTCYLPSSSAGALRLRTATPKSSDWLSWMGRRKLYKTSEQRKAARAAADAKYYQRHKASILSKRSARLPKQDATLTISDDVSSLHELRNQLDTELGGSVKDFGEAMYATIMADEDEGESYARAVNARFSALRRAASSLCANIGRKAGQDSDVWRNSMDILKGFALALTVVEDLHAHVKDDPLFFQMSVWHEKHIFVYQKLFCSTLQEGFLGAHEYGGRPPRPPAPPRPVLVQPRLNLAQLTVRTTQNRLSVKSRMRQLRRPRVDYELGTAQKYLDNYDAAAYERDSWVPHDEVAGFNADTVHVFLRDVGYLRVECLFIDMEIITGDDLLQLTVDIRIHERRQHLREALVLGKAWKPFRRALRAFARPIRTFVEL